MVEASEILEQLSEQLVDLEKRPDDKNLLNAIFRGFHTVKGGAGFLSLTELVDVCHGAENVFDILRNGKRTVTAELMDVILQALDAINVMFAQVQNREPPSPASAEILHDLHELCKPEGEEQLLTASAGGNVASEEMAPAVEEVVEVAAVIPEPVADPVPASSVVSGGDPSTRSPPMSSNACSMNCMGWEAHQLQPPALWWQAQEILPTMSSRPCLINCMVRVNMAEHLKAIH